MISINFKVTENEVTKINQVGDSTTGSIGQIKCTFNLDPVYTDLTCVAVFNNIKIPMIRGVCYADNIPEGRCVVGVYAYSETNGTVDKRISPKPCVIVIDKGSYLEGHDPEPPTASETERFYNLINEAISSGQIKGEKGEKGDKGEQGEQGQQGADGKPGLEYLPKTIAYNKLDTRMYYADKDVKITCPNNKLLNLYQGAFVLTEKKEEAYTASWYLTIFGKCSFGGKEYNYGIHQYYSVSNVIYNSMYLNETELKSLIAQKQDKLIAGTGITITDNNIISYDGTLQYIFLRYGEELPTDPTKIKKNTIYFKYNDNSDEENEATQNWYDEYIYMFSTDGSVPPDWELIGSTKIDLTGYALKSDLPTKTSELTNDSNFVSDENYVHTDNNFTTAEKKKLGTLVNYDDTAIKKQIAEKQNKLSKEQLDNIIAVPNKIDKSAVGNGLKFADGMLQFDIPVATASTTYGG